MEIGKKPQYDPYAKVEESAREGDEDYDSIQSYGSLELAGANVEINNRNEFLLVENSDVVTGDKEPSYDEVIYQAAIAVPIEDLKTGVTLVRGSNMSIEHAKKADVDEDNMVPVNEGRDHQDLVADITGTFSTTLNVPMQIQVPVENAPGIESFNSTNATAVVNADANATGAPSPFVLYKQRLTEKGLKYLMENVGVSRSVIKQRETTAPDHVGHVHVMPSSPVIRSIEDFVDRAEEYGEEPVIEVERAGQMVEVPVRRPEYHDDKGRFYIPEIVYDYFHQDTVAHMKENLPTSDVTSRAFQPMIRIVDAFSGYTLPKGPDGQSPLVRVSVRLVVRYKRVLRTN